MTEEQRNKYIANINTDKINPTNQINIIKEKLNSVVKQVPEYNVALEPHVGNKFPNNIPKQNIITNTNIAKI